MGELAVRDKGGLELLVELEQAGALTPTALTLDPDTNYDRWEALGGMLGQLHRSVAWILGDWVDFGERTYGEKYAQAVDATDYSLQTLMNYASVARRVPPPQRRATLPFSTHALVAKLKPREQTKWLKQAEQEGWTRAQLAQALKDLPPEVERQSVRDLARAVWLAARPMYGPVPRDGVTCANEAGHAGYFVPMAPMKALAEAL